MALTYSHDPVSTRASIEKGVWGRERAGHPGGPVVSRSNSSPQSPCPPKGERGPQAVWEQKETHSDSFHPQPPSASLAVPFTLVTLISLDPKEVALQVTSRSILPLPCVICQNIGIFPVRRTHLTLPRSPSAYPGLLPAQGDPSSPQHVDLINPPNRSYTLIFLTYEMTVFWLL